MTHGKDSKSEDFSGLLRVVLAPSVSREVLQALHHGEELEHADRKLAELFHACGAARVIPVHELSAEEIRDDRYGFARELQVYLGPGVTVDRALEMLSRSPSVESVRVSVLRGPRRGPS